MKKKLINLTPHPLNIVGEDGQVILTVPSTGLARCAVTKTLLGNDQVEGIYLPVHKNEYGQVTGLPDTEHGVIYVVSSIVAQAVKGLRDDVFIPDDMVRDSCGNIIGCRGLAKV